MESISFCRLWPIIARQLKHKYFVSTVSVGKLMAVNQARAGHFSCVCCAACGGDGPGKQVGRWSRFLIRLFLCVLVVCYILKELYCCVRRHTNIASTSKVQVPGEESYDTGRWHWSGAFTRRDTQQRMNELVNENESMRASI